MFLLLDCKGKFIQLHSAELATKSVNFPIRAVPVYILSETVEQ